MGVREDLIAAKALIDTPEKWVRGSYHNNGAHDAHCIIGAVRVVAPSYEWPRQKAVFDALQAQRPKRSKIFLWQWNDRKTTTHSDVMALFDRAIEKAQP